MQEHLLSQEETPLYGAVEEKDKLESEAEQFNSVVIFAGPGGRAFSAIHINNLKLALESHGKRVTLVGDGNRDLQEADIRLAREAVRAQEKSAGKCLFMLYIHGELISDKHTLQFSDTLSYPSQKFISELLQDYTGKPIDLFVFSCYSGGLVKILSTQRGVRYAVGLSPEDEIFQGQFADAFVRKLHDVAGLRLQCSAEDLLVLYLTTLSNRLSPVILTQDKRFITLDNPFSIRLEDEQRLIQLACHFFDPLLVTETIQTISSKKFIPAELYPCALFLNAVMQGAISAPSQHLLELKKLPKQEVFFARYLPEKADEKELFDDASAHQHQVQTRQLGVIARENEGNTFASYRPTEKTQRLFNATVNFTSALLSKSRKEKLILVLTGTPGIGKTHLARAACNAVGATGMPTYYLSYTVFKSVSSDVRQQLKEEIEKNPGLLVVDDVNTTTDYCFTDFINYLHNHTSILITSNASLGPMRNALPFGDNIVTCEENQDVTQRIPWWETIPNERISAAFLGM